MKKIEWSFDDVNYCIFNIPVHNHSIHENTYDSAVVLTLLMLKDLMEKNEIPSKINFKEIENIK